MTKAYVNESACFRLGIAPLTFTNKIALQAGAVLIVCRGQQVFTQTGG